LLSAATQGVLGRLRRGAEADVQARRGFTVARTEALLRLRDVPRGPWAWTLGLVRAARLLSTSGRAVVLEAEEGEERVVTLRFGVGGRDLAGAELRGVLHAAVAGPEDRSEETGAWLGELGERWRAEVGAAINAGLASGPRSIALHTSAAGRAYVRREVHTAGQDPYAEQAAPGRCPPQAFEVVVREARPGVGRRISAWLGRQVAAAVQVERVWREALFLPMGQVGSVELGHALPGTPLALGEHAVWGVAPALGGPWLVRDGVRSLSLASALAAAGLAVDALGGWIACPGLRVTADEASVVRDAGFELLVAWLHDARAHAFAVAPGAGGSAGAGASGPVGAGMSGGTGASGPVGAGGSGGAGASGSSGAGMSGGTGASGHVDRGMSAETGASGHVGAGMSGGTGAAVQVLPGPDGGGGWTVVWPTRVEQVLTASGRAVDRETVAQRAKVGRDFLYVWRHHQTLVPPAMQARTFAVWPSELAVLQASVPELRPVPVRALGEAPQVERVDLTTLAQGSLAPVDVDMGAAGSVTTQAGGRVELRLRAYVHRFPTAGQGATALLAYGRRVAQVRETGRVVAGVTLVCELQGAGIDALRGEAALLQALVDRCREAAERAMAMLLAQGLAHANPWEVPLVRAQAEALTGAGLGLRYRHERGDPGPELTWDESPLLGLVVGRDETGTRPVTLQAALERCRDAGGIVTLVPGQAWPGWAAREPVHTPWSLTPEGRALLERVIGKEVLWDMPTLPELHALPREASAQPGLVLAPAELQRLRGKLEAAAKAGVDDATARAAVLAHLLARRARGRGEATGTAAERVAGAEATGAEAGLDELPLLRRFDPRALQPVRRVSLAQSLSEAPLPGLLVAGSASRSLAGPALLVTPGEAWLLHAEGLRPASGASVVAAPVHGSARPVRRAGSGGASLLVVPVATEVALGALRIDGMSPTRVALWGGGLHIDELQLPAPLECVGGRLTLTRQGSRTGGERLGGEIRGLCRIVVAQAREHQRLQRPGGPQHAGLGEFLARCQAAVDAGQAPLIADILSPRTDDERTRLGPRLAASLQRHPLERLPPPGPRRLESTLRQVLARPVAVGGALLSWQVASLRRAADTGWDIELGKRNAFVQRGQAAEQGPEDAYVAAALAVAALFSAAREAKARDGGLVDEWIADYRLLALVYAHAP